VIFVIDSSVLFDLERGGIANLVLSKARFEAPDLLVRDELGDQAHQFPHLYSVRLTDAEATQAQKIMQNHGRKTHSSKRKQRKELSQVDCAVIALATRHERVLLVGDANLKDIARSLKIECRGLLGFFELLEEQSLCERDDLLSALVKLRAHPRARLPKDALQSLIDRWQSIA